MLLQQEREKPGRAGGGGEGGVRGSPFVPGVGGKPPNALFGRACFSIGGAELSGRVGGVGCGGCGGCVCVGGGGAAEKLPTRGANKMPIQSAELYTNSPGRVPLFFFFFFSFPGPRLRRRQNNKQREGPSENTGIVGGLEQTCNPSPLLTPPPVCKSLTSPLRGPPCATKRDG